jgi:signal transduction histidine kinase
VRALAEPAFTLPAGIAPSDLAFISQYVAIIAVVFAVIGILLLKRFAGRSIGFMVAIVVAVCTLTSMAGVGVIAVRMLGTPSVRDEVLDLMAIAGLAGLAVALFVGRRLTKASRALSSAVHGVGESGVYVAPQLTLPTELSDLSAELTAAHERLAQARSRERALEASRRELVAWVSHDLRTPLAGLRAMAEALEDQVVVDPREVSNYHSQIRREVDRLTLMIDDLFELSRIHAGALRLSKRMVGLEDLVAEVVASAEPVARSKGVRLTGAAVRGMPVYVDAAEMGRALRNLVTNAIRHTPADGVVDVLAEVQSGMACVTVSDACGGIPPDDLPRVFDVAFRGESARTPGPQSGGGLGLSIARGIVEAHSGQIAVRNAGPGCQFLIRLPLARGGVPALNRTIPRRRAGTHTGPMPAAHTGPIPSVPAAHSGPMPAAHTGPIPTTGSMPAAGPAHAGPAPAGPAPAGPDQPRVLPAR